jgi:hypothetical protein
MKPNNQIEYWIKHKDLWYLSNHPQHKWSSLYLLSHKFNKKGYSSTCTTHTEKDTLKAIQQLKIALIKENNHHRIVSVCQVKLTYRYSNKFRRHRQINEYKIPLSRAN